MKRKKNVIHIGFDATWLAKENKSGVGYYTLGLVEALAATYPDQVNISGYYSGPQLLQSNFKNLHYFRRTMMSGKVINALRRVSYEVPFEFLARQRFDFLLFPAYISYPSLYKTPCATVVYDLAYLEMPTSVSSRNQRDLSRFVPISIERSSFLITVSEWSKSRITQNYNVAQPVLVTPVPVTTISNASTNPVLHTTNNGKDFILFIGTLEPRKNIINSINAYAELSITLRKNYSLILAGGKGWLDTTILARISSLQDQGYDIIVMGYVTDQTKEELLKSATVFIMSSYYEGFGMPLLEAMAHNVPVIASDIEVFHEVCNDAALYFNPHDIKDISQQLTRVLTDKPLRQRLARLGKENLKRYSWATIAHDFYNQLCRALGGIA